MKVMLINGSPNAKGCTYTALSQVGEGLLEYGVETQLFHIGAEPVRGCVGCGQCAQSHMCVYDDMVNRALEVAKSADGFVIGSPVYFASANGTLCAFLDRLFYSGKQFFAYKPGACVVSARRAGTTAALERLEKYLSISGMPVVSSHYWPMVHGNRPEEAAQDLEGMQVMRALGRNMAWLLKCIEAGANAGILPPEQEPRQRTNFIR